MIVFQRSQFSKDTSFISINSSIQFFNNICYSCILSGKSSNFLHTAKVCKNLCLNSIIYCSGNLPIFSQSCGNFITDKS